MIVSAALCVLMLAQMGNQPFGNSPMDFGDTRGAQDRDRVVEAADSETDPVKYRAKAKALYEQAQGLLDRELGIEAGQMFRSVMERFPFSRYAVLAEVGLAKSFAVRGEAEAALDGLTRFLKQHPGHPASAEVRYSLVTINWAERPGSFAMLPPPYERDLEDARATVIAAHAFLHFHSDEPRAKEVKEIQAEARKLLYQQAIFLARWYDDQGRPRAALRRYREARLEFSEIPLAVTDAKWAQNLTKVVASLSNALPKEPELHPAAPVIGEGKP